jgi:hypothetical protein
MNSFSPLYPSIAYSYYLAYTHVFFCVLSVKGGNLYIFLFSFCQLLVTNRTVYNINTALQETEKKEKAKDQA